MNSISRRLTLAASIAFACCGSAQAEPSGWAFPPEDSVETARMTVPQRATLAIFREIIPELADAPSKAAQGLVSRKIEQRLERARIPRTVRNFAATVDHVDVDEDRAVVFMKMGPGFVARTAVLQMADYYDTVILPASNLYRRVRLMHPGEKVRFDGYTARFELDGRGDNPLPVALVYRFTDIRPDH